MSNIEWTDATWNPLAGCTPVSPGCANCYAATMAKRLQAMGVEKYKGTVDRHGKWTGNITLDNDALAIPLRRRKPTRYFVNSMSDLFHEAVPFEFVDRVFAVMALTPWHIYQVLTKRPERMAEYMNTTTRRHIIQRVMREDISLPANGKSYPRSPEPWPLPNVWLGTSVENQACADERIPHLLRCPAAVRFLSCEPLLGPLDLDEWLAARCCEGTRDYLDHEGEYLGSGPCQCQGQPYNKGIDWIIVGGESGPRARACDVNWIRGVVEQCKAAGVPVFVKQLGANVRDRNDSDFMNDVRVEGQLSRGWPNLDLANVEHDLDGTHDGYQGAPVRVHLRDPKGGDMSEWPEDLRVREMPEVTR